MAVALSKLEKPIEVEYPDATDPKGLRTVTRTMTRRERLMDLLRQGVFIKTAAQLISIGESTIHEWRAKGGKAKSGQFRQFVDEFDKAIAEGELLDTRRVKALAIREGDAKTLLKMMQIRHKHWRIPKELGVTLTGDLGVSADAVLQVAGMTPEQLNALAGVDLDDLGGLHLPTDDRRPTATEPEEPTDG